MRLFSIFVKSSNLYFPGCITYFKFKDNFELYKNIFKKLGIDFKVMSKNICCGLPALESGYEAETRKLIKQNHELFKEEKITTIITNSPCCYKMFLIDYPGMTLDWNINVKSIWNIILDKLEKNPELIKNKSNESIVYIDNCYLGRYCDIYDEPRKILKLLGYNLIELFDSKEDSFCCGSCGGLPRTNPELADKIAKEKLLQVKRVGGRKLVVSSLNDYEILKKNFKDSEVEVLELSEILADALGINREKIANSFSDENSTSVDESEVKNKENSNSNNDINKEKNE